KPIVSFDAWISSGPSPKPLRLRCLHGPLLFMSTTGSGLEREHHLRSFYRWRRGVSCHLWTSYYNNPLGCLLPISHKPMSGTMSLSFFFAGMIGGLNESHSIKHNFQYCLQSMLIIELILGEHNPLGFHTTSRVSSSCYPDLRKRESPF